MQAIVLWLHLIGVTFWAGGILVNTIVLMPSLQSISPAERGKLMGAFLKRFAPLSWGAIIIVAVTGLATMFSSDTGYVSSDTVYGGALSVKMALVALMILNGAYLGFVVGPKLASFAPPPGAPEPTGSGEGERPAGPPPELLRLQRRMTVLSWVQVGLVVVVLFLSALLWEAGRTGG